MHQLCVISIAPPTGHGKSDKQHQIYMTFTACFYTSYNTTWHASNRWAHFISFINKKWLIKNIFKNLQLCGEKQASGTHKKLYSKHGYKPCGGNKMVDNDQANILETWQAASSNPDWVKASDDITESHFEDDMSPQVLKNILLTNIKIHPSHEHISKRTNPLFLLCDPLYNCNASLYLCISLCIIMSLLFFFFSI